MAGDLLHSPPPLSMEQGSDRLMAEDEVVSEDSSLYSEWSEQPNLSRAEMFQNELLSSMKRQTDALENFTSSVSTKFDNFKDDVIHSLTSQQKSIKR